MPFNCCNHWSQFFLIIPLNNFGDIVAIFHYSNFQALYIISLPNYNTNTFKKKEKKKHISMFHYILVIIYLRDFITLEVFFIYSNISGLHILTQLSHLSTISVPYKRLALTNSAPKLILPLFEKGKNFEL